MHGVVRLVYFSAVASCIQDTQHAKDIQLTNHFKEAHVPNQQATE
jgi:hypothetical protein